MVLTPRQREDWEAKRRLALENMNSKIELIEYNLECMINERDRLESSTIEDAYFEFLREQGSER